MHEEKCLIGVWIKLFGYFFLISFTISLKISNPLVHSKIGRLDFIEITAGNNWKEEWSECISKVQRWTRAKTCFIYVSMWNMIHKLWPIFRTNNVWTILYRSLKLLYLRKAKEEEEKLFQKDFQSDSGVAGRGRPSWDPGGCRAKADQVRPASPDLICLSNALTHLSWMDITQARDFVYNEELYFAC